MAHVALSGDPRPILTDYMLTKYADSAIHYTLDTHEVHFRYVCKPKKADPSKFLRTLEVPLEAGAIHERINAYEGDVILFHIILEQKGDCSAEKDKRAHGVMLLYNRATKEVYLYDILRYHYKGFKANILNKSIASKFIPWLEQTDYIGFDRDSETSIRQAELNMKHTSQHVIEFLTEKYDRVPNAREWYPLLALWELHTIMEMTEQTADDVVSNMLALSKKDRTMLLEELYEGFDEFTDHIYTMYQLQCGSESRYDAELQSCVGVRLSSMSKTATKTGSRSRSRSSMEIFDIGLVDSPQHTRYRMGNEYGQVIMMKYFAQQYPINPYMPKSTRWDIRKNDYMIHWDYDTVKEGWNLSYPKSLPRFLKAMPAHEYAMVLIRLRSKPKENGSSGFHLNSLLYNRKTNELEHFEPHGSRLASEYEPEELYLRLRAFFAEKIPNVTYVSPSQFCLSKTFFQTIESDEMGFASEKGMCAVWALWYIEVRLANPSLSRDQTVKKALKQLHDIGSFRSFIRNYEKYYLHMINDVVKKYYFVFDKKRSKMVLDPKSYFV